MSNIILKLKRIAWKAKYYKYYRIFKKYNTVPFRYGDLLDELEYGRTHNVGIGKEDMEWFWERGFVYDRMQRYGMTRENYKDYMSDAEYFSKSSYKNTRNIWFDDKLSTLYVLYPFKEYLPTHYYSIENKNLRQLPYWRESLDNSPEAVVELIKEKRALAFKATKGGHGTGFMKVCYDGSSFSVNDEAKSEKEMIELIKQIDGYIITEFVNPHSFLSNISGGAPCVTRVVTVFDEKDGAQIVATCQRFGCKKYGPVLDWDGCFWCGVEMESGEIFNPLIMTNECHGLEPCNKHGDTGVTIEGTIPHWELITSKVKEISTYLSTQSYLTYDIVVTEDSFKILEINTHGRVRNVQPFYPLFKNKYVRNLFLNNK